MTRFVAAAAACVVGCAVATSPADSGAPMVPDAGPRTFAELPRRGADDASLRCDGQGGPLSQSLACPVAPPPSGAPFPAAGRPTRESPVSPSEVPEWASGDVEVFVESPRLGSMAPLLVLSSGPTVELRGYVRGDGTVGARGTLPALRAGTEQAFILSTGLDGGPQTTTTTISVQPRQVLLAQISTGPQLLSPWASTPVQASFANVGALAIPALELEVTPPLRLVRSECTQQLAPGQGCAVELAAAPGAERTCAGIRARFAGSDGGPQETWAALSLEVGLPALPFTPGFGCRGVVVVDGGDPVALLPLRDETLWVRSRFPDRLERVTADGRVLAGRPLPDGVSDWAEQPGRGVVLAAADGLRRLTFDGGDDETFGDGGVVGFGPRQRPIRVSPSDDGGLAVIASQDSFALELQWFDGQGAKVPDAGNALPGLFEGVELALTAVGSQARVVSVPDLKGVRSEVFERDGTQVRTGYLPLVDQSGLIRVRQAGGLVVATAVNDFKPDTRVVWLKADGAFGARASIETTTSFLTPLPAGIAGGTEQGALTTYGYDGQAFADAGSANGTLGAFGRGPLVWDGRTHLWSVNAQPGQLLVGRFVLSP